MRRSLLEFESGTAACFYCVPSSNFQQEPSIKQERRRPIELAHGALEIKTSGESSVELTAATKKPKARVMSEMRMAEGAAMIRKLTPEERAGLLPSPWLKSLPARLTKLLRRKMKLEMMSRRLVTGCYLFPSQSTGY